MTLFFRFRLTLLNLSLAYFHNFIANICFKFGRYTSFLFRLCVHFNSCSLFTIWMFILFPHQQIQPQKNIALSWRLLSRFHISFNEENKICHSLHFQQDLFLMLHHPSNLNKHLLLYAPCTRIHIIQIYDENKRLLNKMKNKVSHTKPNISI